ncbi:MAG: oligosaccharide flippase family protein [Candidatus Eisenbacteria bacterium]|nr:oligosaccharide flippase family protein [Candidatus Eisenbacteria bacterium]
MSGLTKKVGVIGFSRMVALSLNVLVVSMFLSRHLDAAAYGTFQQTWFLTHMVLEIALLGFPVGILYFLPKMSQPMRRGFLVRAAAALTGIGALLGCLLWFGAPLVARWFDNPSLSGTLRTFAVYAFFVLPGLPMDAFLISQNRHRLLGLLTVIHAVLLVSAVLLPSLAGAALATVLWCVVGYGAVRTGLMLFGAGSTVRGVPTEYPSGLARRFLAYSLPVGLNDVLRVASRWLDKNIVSAYFTPETFAIYANGAVEIPFVGVLAGAISSVVIPEFSRLSEEGKRDELIALWHRAILKAAAILVSLFAFLMVFAPDFLAVLFSDRYRASAAPFRIYLILLPLRCATYTPILLALGRSRLVAIGAAADVLANLGLSILLIPRLSYLGPAVATVITTYCQATFYLFWSGRILDAPLRRLFPWVGMGRLLLLALGAALPLPLIAGLGWPALLGLAAGALSYFPLLGFLLWRFGPYSDEDRGTVRRVARRLLRR